MAFSLNAVFPLLKLVFAVWVSLVRLNSFPCNAQNTPRSTARLTGLFPYSSFTRDISVFFGAPNVKTFNDGSFANISLTKTTGSGLVSMEKYFYGFFSVAMKLPPGYSSGVVVAFYLSNSETYPREHDEIDFELLGHEKRKHWVLQTNMYGNGSVRTGREEKFCLWFDPTAKFHEYSIIWNTHHVVFLVDNVAIREVPNTRAISPAYPSKPMSLYLTIWDASDWATHGGKYPVDYKFSPYTASLGKLEMSGCIFNLRNRTSQTCPYKGVSSLDPLEGHAFAELSKRQAQGLEMVRDKYMVYSYCKDRRRYRVLPPECNTK